VTAIDFSKAGGGPGPAVEVPQAFVDAGIIKIDFSNPAYELKEKAFYPYVTYIIKDAKELRDDPKLLKAVALGIFLDYQLVFETWQEMLGPATKNLSGFSQEDMFSDLIGFYMAAWPNDISKEKLRKAKSDSDLYLGVLLDEKDALRLMKELGNNLGLPDNKWILAYPVDHNKIIREKLGIKDEAYAGRLEAPKFTRPGSKYFLDYTGKKPRSYWKRLDPGEKWWADIRRKADKETEKLRDKDK
jgi:hypothetical protein